MTTQDKPDISILIFTNNRQKLLARSLSYYSAFAGNVIVADSSTNYLQTPIPTNTKYLHLPNMLLSEKIKQGLQHIKSKYTILSADDDFLSFSGLRVGEMFLRQNEDYASVQGCYINFDSRCPRFLFGPMYNHFYGHNNDGENVQKRFDRAFEVAHLYALMPTIVLKKSFKLLSSEEIQSQIEVATTVGSVSSGKSVVLPVFWMARDVGRYGKGGEDHIDEQRIMDWQEFLLTKNGQKFKDGIKKLVSHDKMNDVKQSNSVERMFLIRNKIITAGKHRSRLRHLVKKCLPAQIVMALQVLTCALRRKKSSKLPGYPWSNLDAKFDWCQMRKCILADRQHKS